MVDHDLVKRFRQEVGDRLAEQRRRDAANGVSPMLPEDERQYARAVIGQVLEEYARSEISVGRTPPNAEDEEALAGGIHAALFGVGRLQPLLDDPEIENIDINGCDQVFLGYADGHEVIGDPVAESDAELVELIQVLAAYSGLSSRPFDSANPELDLRLPDGSRLSAVMDVTYRPALSIRRARLGKVFLADLVRSGTISPELGSFLASAVAARKNIMIAGATNAGKTTLLRALANQIPGNERLVTVERSLELGLDQYPELHPNVVAIKDGGGDPKSINFINYEGGGEETTALLNGDVEAAVAGIAEFRGQLNAGKLRGLAVLQEERLAKPLDNIPTAKQQGYDVTLANWRGVYGPPKMPDYAVKYWQKKLQKAMHTKTWKQFAKRNQWDTDYIDGKEMQQYLAKTNADIKEALQSIGQAKTEQSTG